MTHPKHGLMCENVATTVGISTELALGLRDMAVPINLTKTRAREVVALLLDEPHAMTVTVDEMVKRAVQDITMSGWVGRFVMPESDGHAQDSFLWKRGPRYGASGREDDLVPCPENEQVYILVEIGRYYMRDQIRIAWTLMPDTAMATVPLASEAPALTAKETAAT